ncbi:hypothetical protein EON65_34920 [archaeon]|nr:MAG: hypothetical protein EON65_34920 [archaeon]
MSNRWEGRDWIDATNFYSDHAGRISTGKSIYSRGKFQDKKVLKIPSFRVLSLSVLADVKVPFLFHTSHKAWDGRLKCMLQEMMCYDPDIICLQDVDRFSDSWSPQLMLLGYDAVYKKRTQEKNMHDEGVAIAVRRSRFRIMKTVFVEFNQAVQDDKKGSVFRDRCKTDDVGVVLFVQPKKEDDLATTLCLGSVMLSAANADEDVRNAHARYLVEMIERANSEFHAPVILGTNLNDFAGCMSYSLLRTGRQALSGQVPPACKQPLTSASCRTSALVRWYSPQLSIADSGITSYRISWRTGGSISLGFYEQVEVSAGDCIAYMEVVDANRNCRVVPKDMLQFTVTKLCAEVSYEFRVCAVNCMGPGPWSDPSMPILLPNPQKATRMPQLENFMSIEQLRETREEESMMNADFDISVSATPHCTTMTLIHLKSTCTDEERGGLYQLQDAAYSSHYRRRDQ